MTRAGVSKNIGTEQGAAALDDPLITAQKKTGFRLLTGVGGVVSTVCVHIIGAFLLMTLAPMCNVAPKPDVDEDSVISVAVVDKVKPAPKPEPIEAPEPKIEPPEPKPKPKPLPEPEPKPKPEPRPTSTPKAKTKRAESMDPIHLEGLTKESASSSTDAPAFKIGKGITTGKITNKYVDPSRFGRIQTGQGDGEGYGAGDKPAAGSSKPSSGPTREPRALQRPRADPANYPLAAKRRGVGGTVVAILTIDKQGDVIKVKIIKRAGHGFDALAKKTFLRWKFEPALKNGQPVQDTIRATHVFEVQNY